MVSATACEQWNTPRRLTSMTLVELLQRHLLQARVLGDAGVVDEHVDAAELSLSRW
jgi:hypothetical protein